MSPGQSEQATEDSLAQRILQTIEGCPMKAVDIGRALGVDRAVINQTLYGKLRGRVEQDNRYRWRVSAAPAGGATAAAQHVPEAPPAQLTELGRLCRYYLECVGPDAEQGVSVFASSNHGHTEYAEIASLPFANPEAEWLNAPGVQRVLGRVRADRSKLVAWLGYPVRVREHQTPNWRGCFVEPVMLWPIEFPEAGFGSPSVADDLPLPNPKVVKRFAMAESVSSGEEGAQLEDELGFNGSLEDRPEPDEALRRLVSIRPDWDWQEEVEPSQLSTGLPLSEIQHTGIYNRAVIVPGERSPFTKGLESELRGLADASNNSLAVTALGTWLSNEPHANVQPDTLPILEVVPMNEEQRKAVRAAFNAPHTVVTGPPGTGKSQVVTNLLVNAAWRGIKVLFASKNNKAVDVVEARVNGLANRPTLIRLGSRGNQIDLADFLESMLAGTATPDDQTNYDEALVRHKQLSEQLQALELEQERTLGLRNTVDRLEIEIESARSEFDEPTFRAVNIERISSIEAALNAFASSLAAVDPSKLNVIGRLVLFFTRTGKLRALDESKRTLDSILPALNATPLEMGDDLEFERIYSWCASLQIRVEKAKKICQYQRALEELRAAPALENLANKHKKLTEEICEASQSLWQAWVQLTPRRLTTEDRRNMALLVAALRANQDANDNQANQTIRNRIRQLQRNVSHLFPCWAVTSLSARGRIPFTPAHFELIVIDEASQCDIASALPLLYRSKRSLIIGDPKQLRHISALSSGKDADLALKYGLLESRTNWMYRANSLYDLSTGMAGFGDVIKLLDHHRSHAHIIRFPNAEFYDETLRVATRYTRLKRPRGQRLGIQWKHISGQTARQNGASALNEAEARTVLSTLRDLLIERRFEGTVGVVTPFKAQEALIDSLIKADNEIMQVANQCDLLVDTIHGFQGDERDVMIFSPTVSNGADDRQVGFLRSNGNLFNVAITRARGFLHVVGDRNFALTSSVPYFRKFAEYVMGLEQSAEEAIPVGTDLGPEYPTVPRPERVSEWEKVLYRALYQPLMELGVFAIPQFPVEQYDLDFAVLIGDRKLNIEVDGEHYHRSWTGELCLRDRLRNQRLIELGWEVKRFWVYEVRDRLPECVKHLQQWVAKS